MAQVDTQVISKNDKTRGKRRYKLDWKPRSFERLPSPGRRGLDSSKRPSGGGSGEWRCSMSLQYALEGVQIVGWEEVI